MNETNKRPTEPTSDFERSAKQAFDASVRGVDAATRSRLVAARERALDNAGGARSRLGWSWSLAPTGALAAAAVVAVLLLVHHPRPTELGAPAVPEHERSRDLARRTRTSRCSTTTSISIRGSRSSPSSHRPRRTAIASADEANRRGHDRRALLRARGRGQPPPTQAPPPRAHRAAAPPRPRRDAAAPDLAFLEYLGELAGRRRRMAGDQGMGSGRRAQGKPPDAAGKPPDRP